MLTVQCDILHCTRGLNIYKTLVLQNRKEIKQASITVRGHKVLDFAGLSSLNITGDAAGHPPRHQSALFDSFSCILLVTGT